MTITHKQITFIHALKSKLGWCGEEYRGVLASYGVESSKQLDRYQAKHLCDQLSRMIQGEPLNPNPPYDPDNFKHGSGRQSHEDLASRQAVFATPAQLRKIEAVWRSNPNVRNSSQHALNQFCARICKVQNIRWLKKQQAIALLKAIENIK